MLLSPTAAADRSHSASLNRAANSEAPQPDAGQLLGDRLQPHDLIDRPPETSAISGRLSEPGASKPVSMR